LTDWIQGLRNGTPEQDAATMLERLAESAGRPATDAELEALEQHYEGVARAFGWARVELLRIEAADAANGWLLRTARIAVTAPRIHPRDVKERSPHARAWFVEIQRPEFVNVPFCASTETRMKALKAFIAWAKGAS
jgi:hypothetical protein